MRAKPDDHARQPVDSAVRRQHRARERKRQRERQRRTRCRRRQGVVVLNVEAHEHRLIEALIAAERLTEAEALRREAVEREAARLLEDWMTRWLRK